MPAGVVRPNADIEPVVGIQFGIFSPDEIERRSVVEITNAGTYDGNEPRIGGLFDPRMGVLDNGKTCRSCGQTNHSCPGHFGHFKLARPVYFIQFFDQIKSVLNCVCIKCSKLLIDKSLHKEIHKRRGEPRWRATLAACQNIGRCGQETEDGCGARQPDRYVRDGIATIVAEWDAIEGPAATGEGGAPAPTKQRQRLEVEYVLRLLRRLTDEDVDFMGFSRYFCRPDWMICTVMPIPPPQVRPSVIQDNNQRSEDDLTHKLFEIIMTNQRLQDKINNNAEKRLIEDEHMALQYHVATLVDNQIPGVAPSAQRSGRPLKSVKQRLGSKEGRIRYNIQGKRVEFSARSVITPDPNISIGELGVPMKIAMNLTFPEKVTPYNKDQMYRLVQNGPDKFPGAKTIVRADGRMISLKHVNTKEIVLHTGDVVNRHLNDGDIVLFNRQPTLHRMSMMGHRVKVLPYNTFRLNVSVTAPYNADFDGDEMNAHIPQSYEAATELAEIAAVPHQIVTPRHAKPVIGIVQDTLVGSYRITRPTVNFNRRQYMNMMMWNKRFEGKVPTGKATSETGAPRYNGQQILSELLPPVNMEMGNDSYKDDKRQENMVKIREGEVLQGIFDKGIFSKPSKGIIHTLFKDYGSTDTVQFIDSMQNTIEQFLVYNGFSVGISDLIADEETRKQMEEVIKKRKTAVENILLQIHMDLFDNNTGKTNQQEFEDKVFVELNKATDEAGKAGLGSLADENRLIAMVKAGSKGSNINIAQMMACVGQQAPEGRRIPYGFTDRTLPHYKKYDDGAEARGFVESSFIKGLTPQEFFFHAMSGREGLIDTAVKSVTGDTEIVVMEGDVPKTVRIGDWIDAHLAAQAAAVEHFPEEADLEMLQLETPTYIPSVSPEGKVSWGKVAAVTRHDPGDKLYRVETLGGRSVIVTASKSLLIWNPATKLFEHKNTPDVRPGECMPVTMVLAKPPVLTESIPLDRYLPKTDYIYGTDFHAAQKAVEEAMVDREHVPAGWWSANNGKTFTLPYENKGRFVRTLSRSKVEDIQPGYVYPFTTNRSGARLPEEFPLTKENGIFLGLFLAEGNVDVRAGSVAITNNSPEVLQFVHDWFENLRIKCSEETRLNTIGGVTTTVRGFSTVLAKFLDELCGHGAANKRVPAEAFTAPLEFVKGVLNGYISGDGTVTRNSVEAGSASKALTEGMVMLLSRMGIFAKMFETRLTSNNLGTETIQPSYRWSVRAQWAHKLKTGLYRILHFKKHQKLVEFKPSDEHRNFPFQNDCVLDEITSIEPVDPAAYPKMYDLTVPETFTFGLANGLMVYDTADTGYIQRQLVKAMEDLVTQYDGTVRDSRGNIFQFYYGEDGINATKIESTGLGIGKLSEDEIKKSYGMEGVELATVLAEGTLRGEDGAAIEQFVAQVLEDRRMLVEDIQKSKQDAPLFASVNIERILTNVATAFRLEADAKTDLTPLYVLQGIERLIQKTQSYHKLWAAVLRFYLAPHRLIVKERFTRRAFDAVCEMIVVKNYQSWAQPGEQVGIIAAQSIGEPSTQMSAHKDTWVHVEAADGAHFCGRIADFVDRLLEQRADAVKAVPGHADSVVLDLNGPEYRIVGVSTDEKTSWLPISQVSRHPANGGLVKVVTKSGRTTTATLSHSFLKRTAKGIAPILGSELEVGMRIPVATFIPEMPAAATGRDGFALTADFGWVCGIYLADGSIHGNQVRITKAATEVEEAIRAVGATYGWEITAKDYQTEQGLLRETLITSAALKNFLQEHFGVGATKAVGASVFSMCREFQQGVVGGYFDGDGNVNPDRQQIRAGSRCENLIRSMNRLLGYCGYFGVINEETTVNLPGKVMYTLNILKKYAARYQAEIGFRIPEKAAALDEIVAYCARENKHDTKELYDKIPEVGELIADVGKALDIPGHSRIYGRWTKKESIGRLTLATYVDTFKARAGKSLVAADEIARLEAAVRADVLWDEITELVYLADPKEFVYDFTVPGNDSFMVDDMILVHNTLNTFHLAGVAAKSNVTRGVPRLKELLKVTQNPKAISLTVPLKPEFRGSREKAREVAQDLELTLLKDITVKTAIYFDPNDEESVVDEDRDLLKFYHLFEAAQMEGADADTEAAAAAEEADGEDAEPKTWSGWLLRFELDREHMFRKNITMDDVGFVIRSRFGSQVNLIYSDYNSSKLIMRMRLPDLMKGGLDDLVNLKKFQTRILNGIVFRGVPGIKSVTFREDKDTLELNKETGKYEQVTQYVLDTDGSNFLAVMRHPYVDARRLASSHVHDIYEVLGIEATRQTLLNEITTLFEEAGVNNRHLGLLCDVMTNAGRLMSADRHGINKTDIGPLAKASFEETERILLNAALYGETDPVTGVSANIMMGQPIRGGTGFFNVLLDEGAFLRLQEGLPPAEGYDDEELDEPTQEQIDQELYEDENDLCSSARLRMNVAMPKAPVLLEEEDVEIALLDQGDEE